MDLFLLDDTVVHGALAGILLLLAGAWVAWIAAWLRRLELRPLVAPLADELGLTLLREGWGPELRAVGEIGSRPIQVRFRLGLGALRVRASVGDTARWTELQGEDIAGLLRQAVNTTT